MENKEESKTPEEKQLEPKQSTNTYWLAAGLGLCAVAAATGVGIIEYRKKKEREQWDKYDDKDEEII